MIDFNYHSHTKRCGHAFGEDEEYVLSAIKAGFKTYGISDHMPYLDVNRDGSRMRVDKLEDYFESVNYLKEKYKDKIRILVGFETEYFKENEAFRKEVAKRCDYLLCGQHYTEYVSDNPDVYDNIDLYLEKYCIQVVEAIKSHEFLYITHPDYFGLYIKEFSKKCEEISHRICKAAQDYNVPLEINLQKLDKKIYYKDGIHQPYPLRQFWEIAQDYNIKAIYGWDVHAPDQLLDNTRISKANKIIKDLNIRIIDEPML